MQNHGLLIMFSKEFQCRTMDYRAWQNIAIGLVPRLTLDCAIYSSESEDKTTCKYNHPSSMIPVQVNLLGIFD